MAQSFFDKLTGSLKVQSSELKATPAPLAASSLDAHPQVSIPEAPVQQTQQISKPKIIEEIAEKPKVKEEILLSEHSEVEGQLTVDVYQTPTEIVIKSTIAGVTIDDLDISITNDMVTIRGERKKDEEVNAEDYFHQECYWGTFSRSVILPLEVDSENSVASFKNGILTIRLHKIEKVKTKKIKIAG